MQTIQGKWLFTQKPFYYVHFVANRSTLLLFAVQISLLKMLFEF